MKKIAWILLAILFVCIAVWNFQTQALSKDSLTTIVDVLQKKPILFTPYTTYEVGEVPIEQYYSFSLPICNTGFGEMIAERVSTSCGCVGVDWPREAIPVNGCDSIEVKLSPIPAPMEFNQYVEVQINDNETAQKIYIRAFGVDTVAVN